MLDYWGNGIALLAYCALHACNFIYIQVYIYIFQGLVLGSGDRSTKREQLFSFCSVFCCCFFACC